MPGQVLAGEYPALSASSLLENQILFASDIDFAPEQVGKWYLEPLFEATYFPDMGVVFPGPPVGRLMSAGRAVTDADDVARALSPSRISTAFGTWTTGLSRPIIYPPRPARSIEEEAQTSRRSIRRASSLIFKGIWLILINLSIRLDSKEER